MIFNASETPLSDFQNYVSMCLVNDKNERIKQTIKNKKNEQYSLARQTRKQ